MSVDADVLVAGGGPVGLAAAIEARLAGLSAVVVEPRPTAIDKACGEGLMPGAMPILERWSVHPAGMPLTGVDYRDGRRRAVHRFVTGPGRGVRRTTLHSALAARAAALGVETVVGRIDEVEQSGTEVRAAGLRAGHLIAADGLHSTVRRRLGLESAGRSGGRFGLREHVEVEPWSDLIEVHWTPRAEVYVTPVAADLVGIAVLGPRGTDLDEAVRAVPELADRLEGAARLGSRRGAGPFGVRARRVRLGRVMLVGDASGYVDALTGEGLRLGFEQAGAAVRAILGGVDYEREWKRITRPFRLLTAGLVAGASGPLRGGIVPLASAVPPVYGAIVERLAR